MSDETSIPIDTDVVLGTPASRRDPNDRRIGSRFWEARSKHGRDKIFSSAEILWEACVEYFEWCEDNPLFEERAFGSKDGPQTTDVAKLRAFTLNGLCIFLQISQVTWGNYRKHKDFVQVCSRVEDTIREQKFTGAAADLLNPAIIARDLGLADKREISGPGGTPIRTITEEMSPTQAAEVWLEILNSEDAPTDKQVEDLSKDKGDGL